MRKKLLLFLCILPVLSVLLSGCELFYQDDSAPEPIDGDFMVYFIDVGQADAALVICDGETMLIDGGNAGDSDLIYTFLRDRDITYLDYVVCSHAHEDHVGGLSGALSAATAGTVFCPVDSYDSRAFENFKKAVSKQGLELTSPEAGSTFALGGAEVLILGPLFEYDDTNNTSIVLKITYGNTSFLFTGDMEREAELDLIDEYGSGLSADVLKTGHHGSTTSSSYVFLYEVSPAYAVISCGKNNSYGHPHDDVLSRFRDADVTLYRTDIQGTITCTSDGTNIYFETERNSSAVTNPTEAYGDGAVYIGNVNSKKLHLPTCTSLPEEKNRVIFQSLEEAYALGYEGCAICMK